MLLRLLALLSLLFLSRASLTQESGTAKRGAPEMCPVTKRSDRPFVPPAPYPAKAPRDSFWFGTDRLWTILGSGAWAQGEKTFWWRQDWGSYEWIPEKDASKLTVTVRRLDTPAPAPEVLKGNSSYREDWKSFLVGGINFPSPGCWEIAGHYEEDELTFVVRVAK